MSELADRLHAAAAATVASIERRKEFEPEVRGMFDAIHRILLAEKLVSDDRYEALCRKLDRIERALGTNGTGGGHG